MTGKLIDRLTAAGVFLYALVVYLATMAETSPFWDSGEFIASIQGLQVMHPPGAPLYLLIGKMFSFLAPLFSGITSEPVAFSANLISVLSSAGTILLTHLIIVRLGRIWVGSPETWSPVQRITVNAGGVIGALTFAVTDSFWFNAVEAEVYALSMFFTAAVVYLALRWREETLEEERTIRARGEHPFGLKADRNLLLIAYLFGLAIGVHLLNLLALFFVGFIVFFTKFERTDWGNGQRWVMLGVAGVASALAFFVIYPGIIQWLPSIADITGMPRFTFLAAIAAVTAAVWWTQRKNRPVGNLVALSIALVLIGYSSYGLIPIRSAANPSIDLNEPETIEDFVSYLKREQYGSTPLLSGESYDNRTGRFRDKTLPRRYSPEPNHIQVYQQYNSDLDYFLKYQVGHMYMRYFMWQFAGKDSDLQDAGWVSRSDNRPDTDGLTPSERESRNAYFFLPLLLGLFGLYWQIKKDWRRSLAVGVLFLITGVGIILYLNQYPHQPRERDYSYVASFFAFSLWIGLGATGILELLTDLLKNRAAGLQKGVHLAAATLIFLAVPGWMFSQNYFDHDRSGRRIATDFAINMLESTEPNAVLFTNGDNDTYPLWYAQEVLGIRPDVRVVNLSLLQTPWYIKQTKNQTHRTSKPVPMTLTDEQVDRLNVVFPFQPRQVSLPGLPAASDTAQAGADSSIAWRLDGRGGNDQRYLLTSDQAILDILTAVAEEGWERPVYFASTVAADSELGLQPYFQNEGLARRIVPNRANTQDPDGVVDPDVALRHLEKWQFRNLDNSKVYYDQNARAMADSYRTKIAQIANGLIDQNRHAEATEILERVREEIPFEVIPPGVGSLYTLSDTYSRLGDSEKVDEVRSRMENLVIREAETAASRSRMERTMQIFQFVQASYLLDGDFEAAAALSNRFADATGNDAMRTTPESLQQQVEAMMAGQDSAALVPETEPAEGLEVQPGEIGAQPEN